jgi:predicted hydrocarbon binding protein
MTMGVGADDYEAGIQAAFFIMPTQILKSLHDEFRELAGPDAARAILFRIGFASGEAVTRKINIEVNGDLTLPETLTSLWIEMGLGRIIVTEHPNNRLHVECDGSTEALAMGHTGEPSCDLTRGYLAGTTSALTDLRYHCVEGDCVSAGSNVCVFELNPREG